MIAAVRHHGGRAGWLELGEVAAAPLPESLEAAAGQGVLRTVAVGGGRSVAIKPMRGPAVLHDVLREHFRGCVLVLVHGDVDAPRLEPRPGGWTVAWDGGEKQMTTEELVAALRKPRPWKPRRSGDEMSESYEEIRYFLPGPTWVTKDVREAMAAPAIGHRSPEFKELYQSVSRRLPDVVRTSKEVMVVTASGSMIWDMAVASTVRRDVLNLTNGAFSERFHTTCKAWGRDADRISVEMGQAIDPGLVREALRRKRYEAVTVAHNETSTGVLNPLEDIVRVVREESDALILVDAVSSLGGARVETEDWGIDLLFASSQKALALPPGIAVVSLSDRLRERAEAIEHRGFYTDLLRFWNKHCTGFTLTTPAIPQIRALDVQLDKMLAEGVEARWQRHLELRRMTEEWAADRGFVYASAPAGASPTVSCLKPPAGVDAPSLVQRLKAEGFIVGGGYGPWKPTTFRIAHMGEVRAADLRRLLAKIDELVESGNGLGG